MVKNMAYDSDVKSNIIIGSFVCPICGSHKMSVIKEHFGISNTFSSGCDNSTDIDDSSLDDLEYQDTVDDSNLDDIFVVVECQKCGFLDTS